MNKYQLLSERLYKYFKYLRFITLIGLILFLGVTAFNTHNDILSIISYFFMMLTLVCAIESLILYVFYIVFKNKGE